MALTITDPELIALIRRRSRESGLSVEETLTQVLSEAQENLLAGYQHRSTTEGHSAPTSVEFAARHQRIDALIDRIGQTMDPQRSREQIDELLYDDRGLPR